VLALGCLCVFAVAGFGEIGEDYIHLAYPKFELLKYLSGHLRSRW